MIRLFIIISLIFPFSAFALEPDLCAVGAGNSAYDGTYTDRNSALHGYPSYTNGSKYLYVNDGASHWIFRYDLLSTGSDYYRAIDGSTPSGTYTENEQTAPGPVVSVGTCGSEEEATTTVATSTEALLGTIAFGQGILIALVSLMAVGFVFNTMSRKKIWS